MFFVKTLTCFLFVSNHGFAFFNNNFKISNFKRRSVDQSILRIQDGEDDTNNEFPYVVPLGFGLSQELFELNVPEEIRHLTYKEFIQTCSGNLIAEQWVLTAAHCLRRNPNKIRYGIMNVLPNDSLATYSKILKNISHPAYKNVKIPLLAQLSQVNNDIGLLRIEKVRLDVFGRVLMADYKTLVGLPVTFAGFGLTHREQLEKKHYKYPPRSRKIGRGIVMTCDKIIRAEPALYLVTKCSNEMQTALSGDSGGPILQGGRIVGVIGTFVQGLGNSYNTLTPVSPYLDWMWLVMRTNS